MVAIKNHLRLLGFALALLGVFAFAPSVLAQETFVEHDVDGTNNWSVGADNNAGTHYHEATFTPDGNWTIQSFGVWLARGFNDTLTDDFKIEICSYEFQANSSEMCDEVLATGTIENNTLINDLTYYNLDFDQEVQTVEGTRYVVRFRRTGANSATDYPLLGKSADSPDNSNNNGDPGYPGDADVGHDYLGGYYIWDFNYSQVMPAYSLFGVEDPVVVLDAAVGATITGKQTVAAQGHVENGTASMMWISAVRIDPIGSHVFWIASPTDGTIDTLDFAAKELSNGTWRVRAHAVVGSETIVSDYIDVELDGSTWSVLTVGGSPADANAFATGTPITYDDDPDRPYHFSEEAAEAAAQGGLIIDATGCAHTPTEDTTSTLCAASGAFSFLFDHFPLLSWPLGIFGAYLDARDATDSTTATMMIGLPSHGQWIPEVVLVDSASRTKGIGKYISEERQEFYRSIMAFSIWAGWVWRQKKRADKLL